MSSDVQGVPKIWRAHPGIDVSATFWICFARMICGLMEFAVGQFSDWLTRGSTVVECRTHDREVVGSSLTQCSVEYNLWHTLHVTKKYNLVLVKGR